MWPFGKKIIARTPTEKVIVVFIPRTDFFSKTMASQYIEGSKYYLREGNTRLASQMEHWKKQNLIDIL